MLFTAADIQYTSTPHEFDFQRKFAFEYAKLAIKVIKISRKCQKQRNAAADSESEGKNERKTIYFTLLLFIIGQYVPDFQTFVHTII